MLYLHSYNIIHRDLKAANILKDDYLFLKIADFGLSKKFHQNQNRICLQSTTGPRGTSVYISLEIWNSFKYTKANDIYAFSYIIYEILTLEQPFKGFTDLQLMKKVVIDSYRPEFQYQISVCYQSEMPTFEYIFDQLKNNEEFITNSIDRSDNHDYIDLIDNYSISFEPNKKFNKITVSKEKVHKIYEKINEKGIDHKVPVFFNQNEFIQLPDEIKKIFKESF